MTTSARRPAVVMHVVLAREVGVQGWTEPIVVGAFALSLAAGVAFTVHQRRVDAPLLDTSLFADRGFATGAFALTTVFFVLIGLFFLLPQFFQFVQGLSPLETGVRLLPLAVAIGLTAPSARPSSAVSGSGR